MGEWSHPDPPARITNSISTREARRPLQAWQLPRCCVHHQQLRVYTAIKQLKLLQCEILTGNNQPASAPGSGELGLNLNFSILLLKSF